MYNQAHKSILRHNRGALQARTGVQMKKFVIISALFLALSALVLSAFGCHASAPPAQDSSKSTESETSFQYAKHLVQGMAFANADKHDQAISEFNKAIDLDPENVNNAAVYVSLAISYIYIGEYDKAIAACTKSLELKPDNDQAYFYRGAAYAYNSEYDRAITDFTKSLELKPDNDLAYMGRGIAYGHKGETNKAVADFAKAIKLNPKNADLLKEELEK